MSAGPMAPRLGPLPQSSCCYYRPVLPQLPVRGGSGGGGRCCSRTLAAIAAAVVIFCLVVAAAEWLVSSSVLIEPPAALLEDVAPWWAGAEPVLAVEKDAFEAPWDARLDFDEALRRFTSRSSVGAAAEVQASFALVLPDGGFFGASVMATATDGNEWR
mmetsp:Transcript_25211/g.84150  ORF Transcript_25211/g.84150 Transcript_25211/m.84150 type:complete len:159 (-) Transcript_25211:148-624(-)